MKYRNILAFIFASALSNSAIADSTYVLIRHGEKADNHSGQLTCKGLNRAMTLPTVLLGRYGNPDLIYAAAPKEDKTGNSLRALTTVLPTAITVSKPVILHFHAEQTDDLVSEILSQKNIPLTFIAWEHKNLVTIVKKLVKDTGGDASKIPSWPSQDFDSIYVVRLDSQQHFTSFTQDAEGLNEISVDCSSSNPYSSKHAK